MRFKSWLLNEWTTDPYRQMVEDAVQQVWKVIYIPEHPEVMTTEALVEWRDVRSLFAPTSDTPFYQWISTHYPGFEPGRQPDKITKGGIGTAVFFGDRVFKFTIQKSEAEIAALLGKHQLPQVAILDVIFLSKFGNIFCIAQEKVNTTSIPQDLVTASYIVGDYIDAVHRPLGKNPFSKWGVQGASQDAISQYSGPQNSLVVHAYVELLLQVISDIEKKTGRVYVDTGPKNVGLKNEKPALFDLGGNYMTRNKAVPRIRKI